MMRVRNAWQEGDREAGFSLAELVIATSLTLLITAMTFMVIQAMNRISAVQTKQAYFAKNATIPLELMDKALVQNFSVANWNATLSTGSTSQTVDFITYNATGGRDRHVIKAQPNGKLTQTIYSPWTSTTAARTFVLTDQNANYALDHALFTYYVIDASGSPTYPPLLLPRFARGVLIDLWVSTEGSSYEATRKVSFRNQN